MPRARQLEHDASGLPDASVRHFYIVVLQVRSAAPASQRAIADSCLTKFCILVAANPMNLSNARSAPLRPRLIIIYAAGRLVAAPVSKTSAAPGCCARQGELALTVSAALRDRTGCLCCLSSFSALQAPTGALRDLQMTTGASCIGWTPVSQSVPACKGSRGKKVRRGAAAAGSLRGQVDRQTTRH